MLNPWPENSSIFNRFANCFGSWNSVAPSSSSRKDTAALLTSGETISKSTRKSLLCEPSLRETCNIDPYVWLLSSLLARRTIRKVLCRIPGQTSPPFFNRLAEYFGSCNCVVPSSSSRQDTTVLLGSGQTVPVSAVNISLLYLHNSDIIDRQLCGETKARDKCSRDLCLVQSNPLCASRGRKQQRTKQHKTKDSTRPRDTRQFCTRTE